nr:hypothetical protein [uncultured Allomuricauda sp.]
MEQQTIHFILTLLRMIFGFSGTMLLAREVYLSHFKEAFGSMKDSLDKPNDIFGVVPKLTIIMGIYSGLVKDLDEKNENYDLEKKEALKEAFSKYEKLFSNTSEKIMEGRKWLLKIGIILIVISFLIDIGDFIFLNP